MFQDYPNGDCHMQIKVIGLGGIGSCLVRILHKFLDHSDIEDIRVTLFDGDNYEEKNRSRQHFRHCGNKAEVTYDDLMNEAKMVYYSGISEYVTIENAYEHINEGDIIFLCVDNHATRNLVSHRCEELENVALISGGNELTDGNIQVFIRREGKNITLPLANDFHPEITHPEDRNPDEMSCEELSDSSPQIIFMNNMVAAVMLNAFYAHLQGKIEYDEVYIDIVTNNCRQIKRS